jgi:hypothetical protein
MFRLHSSSILFDRKIRLNNLMSQTIATSPRLLQRDKRWGVTMKYLRWTVATMGVGGTPWQRGRHPQRQVVMVRKVVVSGEGNKVEDDGVCDTMWEGWVLSQAHRHRNRRFGPSTTTASTAQRCSISIKWPRTSGQQQRVLAKPQAQ